MKTIHFCQNFLSFELFRKGVIINSGTVIIDYHYILMFW